MKGCRYQKGALDFGPEGLMSGVCREENAGRDDDDDADDEGVEKDGELDRMSNNDEALGRSHGLFLCLWFGREVHMRKKEKE